MNNALVVSEEKIALFIEYGLSEKLARLTAIKVAKGHKRSVI
jgi:hypothetical protein